MVSQKTMENQQRGYDMTHSAIEEDKPQQTMSDTGKVKNPLMLLQAYFKTQHRRGQCRYDEIKQTRVLGECRSPPLELNSCTFKNYH